MVLLDGDGPAPVFAEDGAGPETEQHARDGRAAPSRAQNGVSGMRRVVSQPLLKKFQKSKMKIRPMNMSSDCRTREP